MVQNHDQFQFLIIGELSRDFLITTSGKALSDIPGGSVLYAGAAAAYWTKGIIGLVAKAGLDFPEEWIERVQQRGFDIRGIQRNHQITDSRFFISYSDPDSPTIESPVIQYSKLGLECPKSLFGYSYSMNHQNIQGPLLVRSISLSEVPPEYLNVTAAHLCPLDITSQKVVSQLLQFSRINTITLEPSTSFMDPSGWADIPPLVKGLTAFIVSEDNLRNLFHGKTADLWEMAEAIAGYGCENVVIRLREQGQFLYDHQGHQRWTIPAYPIRMNNPRGAGDSFCGGFLAGFRTSYSAIEAVLTGNISSSLMVEGNNPFYTMDTIPTLGTARVDALRKMIKKV
jgi:sugar/nucleoside kinase (ribokinase family)